MYFSITEDGQIVKATMQDEKIKSKVKLHKTDEENNALSGVEFGIYDVDGNLLGKYTTDENGNIEIELEYGSYYFQELTTKDGYQLNDEKIYFDVTEDGEVIEKSLVNVKIEKQEEIPKQTIVEMPNTFNTDIISFSIIGGTALVGLGLVLYGKKKKNN